MKCSGPCSHCPIFILFFSFFLNFTVIIAGTFKENKSKMGRVGGCSIKIVEEMHWREPGVVTRLCWLDVEKKIRTNGEQENDCWEKISNYRSGSTNCLLPAVPKLTKRGQPWANSCPATPEASGGLVSVLQRTATEVANLTCFLVEWIPRKKSCAARNSLHFDSVVTVMCFSFLSAFFFSFLFFFVLREVVVLVVAVGGNWR